MKMTSPGLRSVTFLSKATLCFEACSTACVNLLKHCWSTYAICVSTSAGVRSVVLFGMGVKWVLIM